MISKVLAHEPVQHRRFELFSLTDARGDGGVASQLLFLGLQWVGWSVRRDRSGEDQSAMAGVEAWGDAPVPDFHKL